MARIFLIILGLGLGLNNLYSQWVQTDGPYEDANVLTAFEHDSKYFASAYSCGFFSKYSDDNSWTLNSDIHIRAFTIKGDSLFADAHNWAGGSSRYLGLYLFDLNNLDSRPKPVNPIQSNDLFHTDSCIFGGNERTGFYKLSFDGSILEYFNEGLPIDTTFSPWQPPVIEIHVTAVELTSEYFLAGTGKGIYRSTPDLAGWEAINNGLTPGRVTFIKSIKDTLYAGIAENLYFSMDKGISWSLGFSAPSKITSFKKKDKQLFVSTEADGVIQSADSGLNWSEMNSGLSDLFVNFILVGDSSLICGTRSKGIFSYENGTWKEDNSGMICSFIRNLTSTNSKLVSLTDKNVYLQDGDSYAEITPNLRSDIFLNADHKGDTIFVSSYYLQSRWPYIYQSIFYSSDDGNSWAEIDSLPYTSAGGDSEHNIYINGSTIYAWSQEKMFFSDDLGESWRNMILPQQFCNSFNYFQVYHGTPFAIACGPGQLLKRNSGQWELSNTGLPVERNPRGIAFCNEGLFTWVQNYGMYVSRDNGNSWNFAGQGLNALEFGFRDFVTVGQELYVATEKGVFGTKDLGLQWYSCNTGLKDINASSLSLVNDTLYVGTYGNGIWKRAMNNIVLSVDEIEIAENKITVYPNPASDYLFFENISAEAGKVHFEVLDMEGRRLFREEKQVNSNNGNMRFNTSQLSNGIYLYNFYFNGSRITGKFIIAK